jgi:hypothetical protein
MPEKIQLGKKLSWRIKIINTGEDFPDAMELYDEESGYEMSIPKLKSGEA